MILRFHQNALAAMATTLLLGVGPAIAQSPFNPEKCSLRAEVHADGHISYPMNLPYPGYHDEAVPEAAASTLKQAAILDLHGVDAETLQSITCDNFFQHIDQLPAPKGRLLFVAQLSIGTSQYAFFFVLFDPASGMASPAAASLDAKWTVLTTEENFYLPGQKDGQLISWADLYGDQNPALVFERVGHNGTMYNAAIYHYYHVEDDLTLKPGLAREGYLLGLEPDTYYTRDLSPVKHGLWKLSTTLHDADGAVSDLGYALIESRTPGAPFHVAKLHPREKEHAGFLISLWGKTDELLVKGYSFVY
jgi:hypothetical protein